jgi:hypothetical protein
MISRNIKVGVAAFAAALALGTGAATAAQADTAQVRTSAIGETALSRWVTYGHYPTKWQCQAQGRFYTGAKLAKSYRCVRKIHIGPFKTYRLDLLIDWL